MLAIAPDGTILRVNSRWSQITGYPAEIIDLDADLEADLGIDSVKQAQVLGRVRERYHLTRDPKLKISDLPVRYQPRVYGETNISRWRHGWLLLRMTLFAFWKFKVALYSRRARAR